MKNFETSVVANFPTPNNLTVKAKISAQPHASSCMQFIYKENNRLPLG